MKNDRYSRQSLFSPIGEQGQKKLASKHVLIIGAGALGTGTAEGLVRAGVGKLTIVDRDYVEWSNLQRQQLYVEEDARNSIPKAIAAKKRLKEINSEVDILAHIVDVTPLELKELVQGVDLILDATDNFDARMMINDISQKESIPWIYGACVGSYGIFFTVLPKVTPCLRCMLEKIPLGSATCDTAGIISSAVTMVVSYQLTEALKILVEDKKSLRQKLVFFDVWKNENSELDVSAMKKVDCLSCGETATHPALQFNHQMKTSVLCGRECVQIRPSRNEKRDLQQVAAALKGQGEQVEINPYLLSFSVNTHRLVLFQDGRVLVHGTKEIAKARSLYYRYLG
ncbi:thiazole biosynthesis adenylyltransferase ThiF [Bacillus sp. 2205SS5-2]|uniref:thiazole biosynthesis adenylyltransferase ThiF n=1 Tax=Bacillus sp. 2205SS5-2 TaxID=3109031 RepID=UPI003005CEAE